MARLVLALVVLGAASVLGHAARRSLTPATAADADIPFTAPSVVSPVEQATGLLQSIGEAVMNTARRIFEPPASAAPYLEHIRAAELRHGIPESLLTRLLYQESRFRPDIIEGRTKSTAGALGIAQFMPGTAADMGVDPLDPYQSIDGAARYLRLQFDKFGSWDKALAAYNWGPGNVQRKGLDAAPLETRNYLSQILGDVDVS